MPDVMKGAKSLKAAFVANYQRLTELLAKEGIHNPESGDGLSAPETGGNSGGKSAPSGGASAPANAAEANLIQGSVETGHLEAAKTALSPSTEPLPGGLANLNPGGFLAVSVAADASVDIVSMLREKVPVKRILRLAWEQGWQACLHH